MTITQLLEELISRNGTDLHLTVGAPPMLRIDGDLVPTNHEVLTPKMTKELIYSLLNDEQKKRFETTRELDLSFGIPNLSRFRGNVFMQRGAIAMAIRTIPYQIRSFKELGLPSVSAELAARQKGLILVTGPTGSGKSTTLATMIDKVNSERRSHIVTVEDPIEYLFKHKKCIINQRQVGDDTKSFANALKYVLRQDPDVVMVGEMRDLETTESALKIAETGHLTFATLHTNSAAESITRIIDIFPTNRQSQVRTQLAFVVLGILTQTLIKRIRGGRCLALEILVATPAVKALIRDDKVHQIYSHIQAGHKYGMQTMNECLHGLYMKKEISLENAFAHSRNPEELQKMIEQQSAVAV
jgi:twitching motility protein PilT